MRQSFVRNIILSLLWIISVSALCPSAFAMHAWDASSGTNDTVSVRGSYGILNGEAHEIVYNENPFGGRYKLSELNWDLSHLEMAGLVMSCKLSDPCSHAKM